MIFWKKCTGPLRAYLGAWREGTWPLAVGLERRREHRRDGQEHAGAENSVSSGTEKCRIWCILSLGCRTQHICGVKCRTRRIWGMKCRTQCICGVRCRTRRIWSVKCCTRCVWGQKLRTQNSELKIQKFGSSNLLCPDSDRERSVSPLRVRYSGDQL